MRPRGWWPPLARLRCLRTMRLLQDYIDGGLDDRAARRIADHLEACRRCGLEASIYRDIKAALGDRQGRIDERLMERLGNFGDRLAGNEPKAGDRHG